MKMIIIIATIAIIVYGIVLIILQWIENYFDNKNNPE